MRNIIEAVLNELEIKQAELGKKLGVSSPQITQWKKNPSLIPKERRSQLAAMISWCADNMWNEFLGEASGEEWDDFFLGIFESGNGHFDSRELSGNAGYYGPEIMAVLFRMGYETDIAPPLFDLDAGDWVNQKELASLFAAIAYHLTTLSYYFETFIYEHVEDHIDVIDVIDFELETIQRHLILIAMKFVDQEHFTHNNIDLVKRKQAIDVAQSESISILNKFCNKIISSRLPVQADPLAIIQKHPDDLFERCDIDFMFGGEGRESFLLQLPFWEREQIDKIDSLEKKLNLIMDHLGIVPES